jgi:hypothetical protein
MARLIGGIIAGYLAYFLVVFILMSVAWLLLGANGAFRPGVWDVTVMWSALMVLASLLAGLTAGFGVGRIAKDERTPLALAGFVLLMGLVLAWPVISGAAPAAPTPRPEQLPMFDAMAQGQAPLWVALLNPVLGTAGVLLGARGRPPA